RAWTSSPFLGPSRENTTVQRARIPFRFAIIATSLGRTTMQARVIVGLVVCLMSNVLRAADQPEVIHLWPNGAPGFEDRKDEAELAKDYWVKNIHNPSITAYLPPADKANGAAVVICPGGGHRELVFKAEGEEPAAFLNNLGVAAFVLKYRLARE